MPITFEWTSKRKTGQDLLFTSDEEVDGVTLQMLATCGSSEQMQRCGLTKLKDEMKLKKLLLNEGHSVPQTCVSSSIGATGVADRKLKSSEMKALKPEEKHTYLIK